MIKHLGRNISLLKIHSLRQTGRVAPTKSSEFLIAHDEFMLRCKAMGCSESTIAGYRNYLPKALHYFEAQGLSDLKDIKPKHIRELYVWLKNRGLADQTIFNYATILKTFFSFLELEGRIETNPIKRVNMPRKPKHTKSAFEVEEFERLLAYAFRQRDKAMILSLLDTGCRAAEFVALNVGDIDFVTGAVTIRSGKGGRMRIVYACDKTLELIQVYLAERDEVRPEDPLWLSFNTGSRLTASGLRLMLRRLGKRAQVDPCHPHRFRRTFAIWCLRAGMNIYPLQRLMGHTDIAVLRQYLPLAQDDLAEAHQNHGAVSRLM